MFSTRFGTQVARQPRLLFSTNRAFRLRTFSTKAVEYHEGRIEGTVPHHDCYIFLHASEPPSLFPSVHKTSVSLELQKRASNWGGLVNFSWFRNGESRPLTPGVTQPATVFSRAAGMLEIPDVSLENMDQIEHLIQGHLSGSPKVPLQGTDVHIYVCTHGARDCRCGERGKAVYDALVEAVERQQETNPTHLAHRIKVGEVSHVGGHKYAANVLIYPQGEWLGIVKPEDASSIIARICEDLAEGVRPLDASASPTFISHWRGRMGLSKDEQKALWAKATGLDTSETESHTRELKPRGVRSCDLVH